MNLMIFDCWYLLKINDEPDGNWVKDLEHAIKESIFPLLYNRTDDSLSYFMLNDYRYDFVGLRWEADTVATQSDRHDKHI